VNTCIFSLHFVLIDWKCINLSSDTCNIDIQDKIDYKGEQLIFQ